MLSVKQRQINLQFLNYDCGCSPNGKFEVLKADGIEGNKTKKSYYYFQRDFGCSMLDGDYGKETETRLLEVIKNIQNTIGTKADGLVGSDTILKLKTWQQGHGLSADGICGTKTRSAMNSQGLSWDNVKHFKPGEFTCGCGCGYNVIKLRLVYILEDIRSHFGNRPVIITSGCRCTRTQQSCRRYRSEANTYLAMRWTSMYQELQLLLY